MIIRSAFWLCIGFVLVAPHGTDFVAVAAQVRDRAIQSGSQAVAQVVVDQTLSVTPAKAVAKLISASPSVVSPMQDSSTSTFVFPRPRPAAMG